VQNSAAPTLVQQELKLQIERMLATGIDITHIDSHMGTVFHPQLLPFYLQLAQEYGVPAFMLRQTTLVDHGVSEAESEALKAFHEPLQAFEIAGYPLLDSFEMMPLDSAEKRLEEAKERLNRLPEGISYFIFHPAKDTPELRAYAPDWASRVADYELFMDDRWRNVVEASGVKRIGWRVLRDMIGQDD
jgi:predicted glycoside hydrolase/deacetylase ChbG (UPF0249 family)